MADARHLRIEGKTCLPKYTLICFTQIKVFFCSYPGCGFWKIWFERMKNNMTERQGVYADHFSCTFKDPNEFLSFLRERKQNSSWMTVPSKNIQFQSIEAESPYGNLYMRIYQNNGRAEVLADTQENTCILLNVNGYDYPVRSCAIKTILERAG